MCIKCFGFIGNADNDEEMVVDGDVMEKVAKFLYLWDVLSFEGGVHKAVTARIRSGWKKFNEIASVLCKRAVSLRVMYKNCARKASAIRHFVE